MRFDDPERPTSENSALKTALQSNGSPLPTITLMFPMESETSVVRCDAEGNETEILENTWGWLACVHAHRAGNRFGTHYGWVRDLGEFQRDYLENPEEALRKYFKYNGPEYEITERGLREKAEITEDIFS